MRVAVMGRGKIDYAQVLGDAFGTAIGGAIDEARFPTATAEEKAAVREMFANDAPYTAGSGLRMGGGSGLSFSPDMTAKWSRQVDQGIEDKARALANWDRAWSDYTAKQDAEAVTRAEASRVAQNRKAEAYGRQLDQEAVLKILALKNRDDPALRGYVNEQIALGRAVQRQAMAEVAPAAPGGAQGWFDSFDGTGARLTNSTYRTVNGSRDIQTGRFAADAWTVNSVNDTAMRAPQGFSKKDVIWDGIKWEAERKFGGTEYTLGRLYDTDGQFLGARTYERGLAKFEAVAKSTTEFEVKGSLSGQTGVEYASGSATPFGAKLQGNISSGADATAETAVGLNFGGNSIKINAFGNVGASAALLRAQGEAGYDFKFGPLTVTPKANGEVQALGLGATAGGGYRSFDTRNGGQFFVTAGATPVLVGGKLKLSLTWDWDTTWKRTP
ncbi:hypothetical protein ACQ86G_18725 [Roseateles chitinivorans]|uniref:hypothetical protein n=1 Tax=Roseateles chitinivorans TaxID=2917965 RepID=UPI003D669372